MGLGKWLGAIGGAVAAPFTGGASLIPVIAGAAGNVLGNVAQGRQAGRAAETNVLQQQDQTALQRFLAAQNAQNNAGQLDLQRKQFSLQAPGQRAANSTRGDILATLQKPTLTDQQQQNPRAHIVDFLSGAPTLSDNTRALGRAMSQQALDSQNAGDTFTGGELLPVPQASALPKPTGLDKFLNIAGGIGTGMGIAGEIGSMIGGQPQQTTAGQYANAVPNNALNKLFSGVRF